MKEIETFLDTISDGLRTLANGIETLAKKVDELSKSGGSGKAKGKAPKKAAKKAPKKAAAKKAPAKKGKAAKKPSQQETAYDTVVSMIQKSAKGVDTATIKKNTGFDAKKIANIIYKAKKQGKIKAQKKGVYIKA